MSKKFVIAKAHDEKDLPGTPHAMIVTRGGKKSTDPLRGTFLCTVDRYTEEKKDSDSEGDEKEDDLWGPLAGKKRRAQKSDLDEEGLDDSLYKQSRASAAAAVYESEFAKPQLPKTRRNKGEHAAILTEKSDVVELQRGTGRKFVLIPNPDEKWMNTLYVAGPKGSGKSTFIGMYCRRLMGVFKKLKFYGLSHALFKDDPAYDGIPIRQLDLKFFDPCGSPPFRVEDCEEPHGSMFVFDDWDTYTGEEGRVVEYAIGALLHLGRKKKISVIITSHLLSNYSHTRKIINGCEWLVVFPHHTQEEELVHFMRKVGMKKDAAQSLRGFSEKWCCIHQSNPTFLLSETCARML